MSPLDSAVLERAQAGDEPAALQVGEIAALHAREVDRDAVLPAAAIAAMKRHGMLGAMVPRELGGQGATLGELASEACALGRSCSATAMIYAMHQIQLACLVAHGMESEWHRHFMRRVVDEQLLLASVTSEAGVGGSIRESLCAVSAAGGRFSLRKAATAISYGDAADALLITARRDDAAAPSDQVLVVAPKQSVRMERTGGWDPIGMRGTRTEAFTVHAEGAVEQIMPAPFSQISASIMQPVSHVLWSALWIGIAADAMDRARAFLRAAMRKGAESKSAESKSGETKGGGTPPGAARLVDAVASLQMLQAQLRGWLVRIDVREPAGLSMTEAAEMNNLKVQASETCLHAVREAMMICGFAGYQNTGPFSLSRHIRDLQSAPLMISNDRIRASTASLLLGPKLNLGNF